MQISQCCFRKLTKWRVIGNFEGEGVSKTKLFRGGSKAALVFQTGGAKVKKILCAIYVLSLLPLWGRYNTQFPTVLSHCSNETYVQRSQWRIQGRRSGSPPLILRPNWRAENFVYLRVWMTASLISRPGSGTGSIPITWYRYSFFLSVQKVYFIGTVLLCNSPFLHSRKLL